MTRTKTRSGGDLLTSTITFKNPCREGIPDEREQQLVKTSAHNHFHAESIGKLQNDNKKC